MVEDSEKLKKLLMAGNFVLTVHAQQRMHLRSVSTSDLIECGRTAFKIKLQENQKYKVKGYDLDGDELSIICVLFNNVVIITVF